MTTKEQVLSALSDLGGSSDEIAMTLHHKGIKGKRTCRDCPIARFLVRDCGQSHANVSKFYIIMQDGFFEKLPTPSVVAEFIVRFDNGDFHQLVDYT